MVGRATPTADIMNGARNWTTETINMVWLVEIRGTGLFLLLLMSPPPGTVNVIDLSIIDPSR
jgi:hypothetical protein